MNENARPRRGSSERDYPLPTTHYPLSTIHYPLLLPLLAFGWTNLPMLGWLAAAALPIVIHLWSRRRYREMSWAAMEYLLAAAKRQTRWLRFEQWLLLLVRTLVVVLVVLAVAEPYVERAGFSLSSGGHAHRVLVLDGSYSMAYRPTDKTRFERAKELARQIVAESPSGDAFTLVLMSSLPRVVVGSPTLDSRAVIREIDNLQLPHATADLSATIGEVRKLMDSAKRENLRLTRHEVYFLTDMQRLTWVPKASEAAATELQQQMNTLAETATLHLIDLGHAAAENLAVTNLRAENPVLTVGRSVQLVAEVRNFGRQTRQRQPVELVVDGRRIEQRTLDISPGATASVEFSQRFDVAADHAIEVRAAGDALDVDNHRFLVASVRSTVRVLCIDGRPSGIPFRGAADYLAVALAPRGERTDLAPMQVDVAAENAIRDRNLAGYDCVFLCNVAQFTASEARILDAYLQGGGSVVFFLGDQVMADRYNREIGGAGQGRGGLPRILPARLDEVIDRPQFRLDPLGYRHPIVQAFRGRGEASLLTTPVLKYFKLAIPENSRAKTVLALGNGDPLVIEEPIHRGRVALVATSADPSWSALPLWPSFVPLVQEIVAYGVRGQLEQRGVLVGEPLDISVGLSAATSPVRVQLPDGRTHSVQVHTAGDYAGVIHADTKQSGVYVVQVGPPANRSKMFAVNVDTVESDLTQIKPDELSGVWPAAPFVYQTSWQDLGATGVGGVIHGSGRLHVGLLYAALLLLFAETAIAWRMGNPRDTVKYVR